MQIVDKLYGCFEVSDGLAQRIIELPVFQRLNRINQYGGVNYVYPDKFQITRFEHSVGVYHVLESKGCAQEVCIAALLHDIGHTALSHMVDQAMNSSSETFHEEMIHLLPGMEELRSVLNDAGLSLKEVDEYPEIKTPLPGIGADRFDYAMRDFVGARLERSEIGLQALRDITLIERRICFQTPEIAAHFAIMGLEAMWEVIYAPKVAVVYQALTEMLRIGLNEGWITHQDLFLDDAHLMRLFRSHRERLPAMHLMLFERPFEVSPCKASESPDFIHIKKKARFFDPPVLHAGSPVSLSTIHPEFSKRLNEFLSMSESRKGGSPFKVSFSN